MAEANEYSEFRETPEGDDNFAKLNAKVGEISAAEQECADLAAKLKTAQEKLRDLTWRQLPEMLDSMQLEEFKTKDGLKVTIKEEIDCGITQEKKVAAHAWLDENGHSGLLKRNVTVAFNRDQSEAAQELVEVLSTKFPGVAQNMNVHPSTLKAWIKEQLAEGKPLPLDLFGVFRHRVAKITQAKK
jgi:hypothetical protein